MKTIQLPTDTPEQRDPASPTTCDITAVPAWKAFADYFERREGFKPSPGDSLVKRLYNYYLIGSWDFEQGLHRKNSETQPHESDTQKSAECSCAKNDPLKRRMFPHFRECPLFEEPECKCFDAEGWRDFSRTDEVICDGDQISSRNCKSFFQYVLKCQGDSANYLSNKDYLFRTRRHHPDCPAKGESVVQGSEEPEQNPKLDLSYEIESIKQNCAVNEFARKHLCNALRKIESHANGGK